MAEKPKRRWMSKRKERTAMMEERVLQLQPEPDNPVLADNIISGIRDTERRLEIAKLELDEARRNLDKVFNSPSDYKSRVRLIDQTNWDSSGGGGEVRYSEEPPVYDACLHQKAVQEAKDEVSNWESLAKKEENQLAEWRRKQREWITYKK